MTARYTLVNPLTGESNTVHERDLTLNLQLNVILLRKDEYICIITHRDLVSFCRWCAEITLARCQTAPSEARAALELVDKWLVDPGSVSNEELNRAAETARAATRAAAWAVRAAAWAAARAARAAGDAARAAAEVAGAVESAGVSFEAQARWFVEHLSSAQ